MFICVPILCSVGSHLERIKLKTRVIILTMTNKTGGYQITQKRVAILHIAQQNIRYYYYYHNQDIKTRRSPDVLSSRTPVNTKHLYDICTMLDQRRRCWAYVVQMSYKWCVFADVGLLLLQIKQSVESYTVLQSQQTVSALL